MHFFISYAKKDTRTLALALNDALNALSGVTAWVDRSLRAGRNWELQIQNEIDRCDYMIVLYSPDINRHKQGEEESYVLEEIAYAKRTARKPIIPVMAQQTPPPIGFTNVQYVDFTLDGLTIDDLLKAILEETGIVTEITRSGATETAHIEITPAPQVEPAPGTRMTDDKDVVMVYVPTGRFLMGSTPQQVEAAFQQAQKDDKDAKWEWYKRELPQHEIVIASGFWLDLTPVTNAMYARFVDDNGYITRDFWTPAGWEWVQRERKTGPQYYNNFASPQQPRVGVTWFEAYAYCQWRGGRLPTEAEWEWAARGPENRTYPWGNTFEPDNVIYDKNSGGKTAPVGSAVGWFSASWAGALDMSGNVWEWVSTRYLPYPYRSHDGREDTNGTDNRVLRGGSWWTKGSNQIRASYRNLRYPDYADDGRGFRCARSYHSL